MISVIPCEQVRGLVSLNRDEMFHTKKGEGRDEKSSLVLFTLDATRLTFE